MITPHSMTADYMSPTPYSDATQVRIMSLTPTLMLHRLESCPSPPTLMLHRLGSCPSPYIYTDVTQVIGSCPSPTTLMLHTTQVRRLSLPPYTQ